jgi:hypothetical protein
LIGKSIENSSELHVLKFKGAMKQADENKQIEPINIEHEGIVKNKVWILVKMNELEKWS